MEISGELFETEEYGAEEDVFETFEEEEIPLVLWEDTFTHSDSISVHGGVQLVFVVLGIVVLTLGAMMIKKLMPSIVKK